MNGFANLRDIVPRQPLTKRLVTRFLAVALSLVIVFLGGCGSLQKEFKTFNESKLAFWNKDEPSDGSAARKMVTLWSDTTAVGVGKTPTRGLGGRIYFYDEKHQTMTIDGELAVYAYDDDTDKDDSKPSRKFVFRSDEFQKHLSESDFGPSYSVWLPWDAVGNGRKSVSLVPVFKTVSGNVLVGDHSRNLLPGQSDGLEEKTTTSQLSQNRQKKATDVRTVSYDDGRLAAKPDEGTPPRRIQRKSIRVPDSMRQRLMSIGETAPREPESGSVPDARTNRPQSPIEPDAAIAPTGAESTTAPTSWESGYSSKNSNVAARGASPPAPRFPIRPRPTTR